MSGPDKVAVGLWVGGLLVFLLVQVLGSYVSFRLARRPFGPLVREREETAPTTAPLGDKATPPPLPQGLAGMPIRPRVRSARR